jgi:hypothetical protein
VAFAKLFHACSILCVPPFSFKASHSHLVICNYNEVPAPGSPHAFINTRMCYCHIEYYKIVMGTRDSFPEVKAARV